jgi:N-methylhydantoinase A/oxoprolinase/acetone carboxylase beta subunit
VGTVEKPVMEPEPVQIQGDAPALLQTKNGLKMYDRDSLPPGTRFDGPALVFQLDSTTYVAPGWSAYVDGYRNLVLERH